MILANHDSPRILILRGGALGDFVLTLPAIRALRRHWPLAAIELLAHPGFAGLAVEAGLVNRARSLDAAGLAQWFVPRRIWPERERSEIASFDLILSYLGDVAGVVQANLRTAGAPLVKACSPIVAAGHAVDHFLRPVMDLGIAAPSGAGPLLVWPEALRQQGRQALKEMGLAGNVISLHPGSGSIRKNWPAEKFLLLADRVRHCLGARPLFVLGEADTAAAQTLLTLKPAVPVFINRTLKEVASVLAASRGYVGNDSGITHLAAALGIPVVALFGPTDAERWGPRGAQVGILRGREPTSEALAAIEPDAVLQVLANLIEDC